MALQKNIATPYGVDATYWVITKIAIDRLNLSVEMHIAGYADKNAEEQKLSPLTMRVFHIQFSEKIENETGALQGIPPQVITEDVVKIFETVSKMGYGYVHKAKEFEGAEDV